MVADLLSPLVNVFTMLFAVTSMFAMGLRVTPRQIMESLQDVRLVIVALVANFAIVPAVALLLASLLIANPDLRTGLVLIGSAAGAPLVPKLAQIAGGSIRFAVGLVVLLVAVTVIYLPIALPLMLPGVQVNVLDVATPLFLQMLLPLITGFFLDARYPEEAEALQPIVGQIATTSLALVLVLTFGLNVGSVIGLFGSGAIVAVLLLIAIALVAGYFLGGPDEGSRRALSLGTAQRNMAAAFVIGTSDFAGRPDVLLMLAVGGLVGLLVVLPVAGEFGRRSRAPAGEL